MYGFRAGLAVNDVHLCLYTDLLQRPPKRDSSAILALDLQKAFGQVSHQAIVRGLARLAPGERSYNYVKAFLSNRTARYKFSDLQSPTFQLRPLALPKVQSFPPPL